MATLREAFDRSKLGRALAACSIVVCEGDRGWDDYLLLHHFDPDEKLDEIQPTRSAAKRSAPKPSQSKRATKRTPKRVKR